MIRLFKSVFYILIFGLFISCGSTKRVNKSSSENASKKETKEVVTKKPDRIYSEADVYFDKFKKNNPSLNSYTLEYIDKYKDIAIKKMKEYRIPASITLAQGILESGNGRSDLAKKANNHFGIKCHSQWRGKKVYHDDDKRNECFRKYDNPEGSFNDHSLFLTSRSRYSFLFDYREDDYKSWAKGLKKAGYATDRKYPSKLIGFIQTYHLHHFDKLVLKSEGKKWEKSKQEDYIIVSKGDTLYSISKKYDVSVEALKKINKLSSNNIKIGQKLYLN